MINDEHIDTLLASLKKIKFSLTIDFQVIITIQIIRFNVWVEMVMVLLNYTGLILDKTLLKKNIFNYFIF